VQASIDFKRPAFLIAHHALVYVSQLLRKGDLDTPTRPPGMAIRVSFVEIHLKAKASNEIWSWIDGNWTFFSFGIRSTLVTDRSDFRRFQGNEQMIFLWEAAVFKIIIGSIEALKIRLYLKWTELEKLTKTSNSSTYKFQHRFTAITLDAKRVMGYPDLFLLAQSLFPEKLPHHPSKQIVDQ